MSSVILTPSQTDLFDDDTRSLATNGTITNAQLMARFASAIRYYQHAGRPLFNWWDGDSTLTTLRFMRLNALDGGGTNMRGQLIGSPASGTPTGSDGYNVTVTGGASHNTFMPSNAITGTYPVDAGHPGFECDTDVSGVPEEIVLTSFAGNTPYPFSGCFAEDFVPGVNSDDTVTDNLFAQGYDIIADKTNSTSTMDRLEERFQTLWFLRRPQCSWSCPPQIGGGSPTYIDMTVSKNQYRIIGSRDYDQLFGVGGSAVTIANRGVTIPLKYSASGIRTQIKVYVWVYAAMSGATNTGSLAVCNKDSAGSFNATFTALSHGPTISGTTFQWYPAAGGLNLGTAPYFEAYAGSSYDRVILGAKSSGTTDSVRIGGWTFAVVHHII